MKNKTELIDFLRSKGYPKRIKGNDGYEASLYDMQPLFDGEFMAIYSYGVCEKKSVKINTTV